MKFYRYIRILSLDVVAGACISSLFIGKILNVTIPVVIVAILGITVWVIYTLDHLWDALRIPQKAHSYRHVFHQHYFKQISLSLIIMLSGAGIILFYLPPITLQYGVLLSIIVMIYFIILLNFKNRNIYLKEISIGVIYTFGLFLGPLSLNEYFDLWTVVPLFFQFLGLSIVNLMVFSLFEKTLDEVDGHGSIVGYLGENKVKIVTIFSLILVIVITLVNILSSIYPSEVYNHLVILCMAFVLLGLLIKPRLFIKNESYRIVGDGVFIFPVLLL